MQEGGKAALADGSGKALAAFLAHGQYVARSTDEEAQASKLVSDGGPEVKDAAKIALAGPVNKLHDFIAVGQYMADRKDQLAATHVAQVTGLVAQADSMAAKSAATARDSADATARDAADAADRDAAAATGSAAQAAWSANYAQKSATQANENAAQAKQEALDAGKSAEQAGADAKAAWKRTYDLRKQEEEAARKAADEARKKQAAADKKPRCVPNNNVAGIDWNLIRCINKGGTIESPEYDPRLVAIAWAVTGTDLAGKPRNRSHPSRWPRRKPCDLEVCLPGCGGTSAHSHCAHAPRPRPDVLASTPQPGLSGMRRYGSRFDRIGT
ncbi:hypothetical protein OG760_36410 [Streptomyces sp. NBC_00963]|uniref:ALF repeat-containing protein n=1 Tax=Streptomyces sp. NBC_00963 TaxID=2903697 RepID=UPI00386D5F20|nr:hypothetical protein OG760_36410 [Streptomyces sp. NBC_00963]